MKRRNDFKRKHLISAFAAAMALVMAFSALAAARTSRNIQIRIRKKTAGNISVTVKKPEKTVIPVKTEEEPTVMLALDGKLVPMGLEDYVACVVAAEMSVTYEPEALKAQAVATRTYTVKNMTGSGCDSAKGADVCSSSKHCQAFVSEEALKERWGDDFEAKFGKIKDAVSSTKGQVLTYEGKIISALYHSSSSGSTEDNKNVYSNYLPYLISVSTPEKEVEGEKEFTLVEIKKIMSENYDGFDSEDIGNSIKVIRKNSSDRVEELCVGNIKMSGKEARKLFSLRSTDFTVSVSGGTVRFKTEGHGHGVGMSQKGANEFALQGMSYGEILAHYYTGTELCRISGLGIGFEAEKE